MKPNSSPSAWQPCYVDPAYGIAEFEGLRITADPMTWPGHDRVLPIFAEEQVFMCREMKLVLAHMDSPLALDVGTGCGVFALFAAKMGCSVVAIDINPRAICQARRNAAENGIDVVETRADLRLGTIYFEVCDFNEQFVARNSALFDLAFLNPPYNPTHPGLVVALHANAGPDAQEQFHRQVALLPSVLASHGACIGNQMALVEYSDGNWAVANMDELRLVFAGHCHIRYTRMMEEGNDIAVSEFLRKQYEPLVRTGRLSADSVDAYIRQASEPNMFFAMVYYEVRRAVDFHIEYFEPVCGRPMTKWSDRLWIHHCTLETAQNSLPPKS